MSSVFFGTFSTPYFAISRYVLLIFTHSLFIEAACYYPDGTLANGDISCPSKSSVDADYCCGKGHICLTNKICLESSGQFVRGSCTDSTWNSPACPSFCISENLSAGARMIMCQPLSLGIWCCASDIGDKCCEESSNLFTLGQVSIVTSKPFASTTSGSQRSSTTLESSAPISNSASTALASPGSKHTATSSGTATPTSSSASSSGLSDSAKVGIGTGISLGAIIIMLLVCLVYYIKQVRPKTQNHGARGKDHFQAGMTNGFQQQVSLAELENTVSRLHQDRL